MWNVEAVRRGYAAMVANAKGIWSVGGMAATDDGNALDPTPPFGAYAPTPWQQRLLALTRSMPETWIGKRAAFLLRRLAITGLKHPLDVEAFGARMRLHPFNNVCEKRVLFTPQFFDPRERALLASRVRPDFVFIDVGANVGVYALFVAKLAGPQAKILAIEPQPAIFDRLVYNIGQNPDAMVKAIGCALADKDGELTLFVDSHNSGESSIKILGWTGETGQSVQVPARTLLGLAEDEGLTRIRRAEDQRRGGGGTHPRAVPARGAGFAAAGLRRHRKRARPLAGRLHRVAACQGLPDASGNPAERRSRTGARQPVKSSRRVRTISAGEISQP